MYRNMESPKSRRIPRKLVVVALVAISLIAGSYVYLNFVGINVSSVSVAASAPKTTSTCVSSLPNIFVDWQGNGTINIQQFFQWLNQNETNGGMIGQINTTQIIQLIGPDSSLSINEVQIQTNSNAENSTIHFVFVGNFHVQQSWGYLNTQRVVVDYVLPNNC